MSELTREEIQKNLLNKIDDSTFDHISHYFNLNGGCPTCGGRRKYTLNFETYECDCEMQMLLQRHYLAANIGKEYHNICLDDFFSMDKDKIVPVAREYIEKFEDNFYYGVGITYSGPVGTGKTFAMNCVLKELIKQGRMVYFINFEQLIDAWASRYKDPESERILDLAFKVDVLGVDEWRTDKRNEGGCLAAGFDRIIRHRTSNLLPTFGTTNMTRTLEEQEFYKAFSLLSGKNIRVETVGHDVRMRELRDMRFAERKRGDRRPVC